MQTTIPVRSIECDGAFNLRDLGGYTTADGRTTRWRVLYRADGLHRVDPADARIDRLGLRTVLDLRTRAERETGAFASDGVGVVHLPLLEEAWEARTFDADLDAASFLAARYVEMLEIGAGAVGAAFELLASAHRMPLAFHCSAGKDRTGVLAALVLSILGVTDDDVAGDYHLSAPAMDRLVAWFAANHPEASAIMARQPRHFMLCPPDAMLRLLAALRERHGSVEGYLTDAGVSPGAVHALRVNLLEG